ncbi:MAG: ROK family protein [Bacteroidota bacterium]
MQKQNAVVGIDIGGTFTKIGIVDREGKMLVIKRFPSHAHEPFTSFIEDLAGVYQQIKAELVEEVSVIAVGVGAPDTNCFTGIMEHPPNFDWGEEVPLAKSIEEVFKVPVFVNNDANVAALGEMQFGGGKGLKHLVVITLGTGLGSGFIVNGQLHLGQDGMAGEIGHTVAVIDGRPCKCGLRGCLEKYVSVTGIRANMAEILANSDKVSTLSGKSFEELTGHDINEAALNGDELALAAFEMTGRMLGQALADVVAYFNPEAIFLTGGLAKAGALLLEPTRKYMKKNLLHVYKGRVDLLLSELVNREGAVLGAAALGWKMLENK